MDQILEGARFSAPIQANLYNGYWISFPGVKQPGCGSDHPPPPNLGTRLKKEQSYTLLHYPWAFLDRYLVNFYFLLFYFF
jgi:hypothetical protein